MTEQLLPSAAPATPSPIRLSLNESPYGPTPSVLRALRAWAMTANRYPEFVPDRLRGVIAAHVGVPPEWVTVGPGATGLFERILAEAAHGDEIVGATPTFDGYPMLANAAGVPYRGVALRPDGTVDVDAIAAAVTSRTYAVVLCSPHNPTGSVVDPDALMRLLDGVPPRVRVILDEAYLEFAEHALGLDPLQTGVLAATRANLVVLRTFSKAFGLAGVRAGYAFGSGWAAAALRAAETPFSVGPAAEAAVPAALDALAEVRRRVHRIVAERERLAAGLRAAGANPLPSMANFLYLPAREPAELSDRLARAGILVRSCATGVRISVGTAHDTDAVLDAMRRR
ncbi:aminotransferase class I/II-fold pyridoxal phosphate-dependent enzyme [Tsukamurella sp. 8F]|uniref:pyridoxal phosphate-dependent aminotransferase n=1 Tax=unclassified Tsukamurella TaxID=2633480 RepID=UPI0023BA2506|nr:MULTISPECIES: aminotransferase class I/II-fold pyridoxal phosphate-dependent enzyme [unclassified Tsukamurella]MDF0529525.1 aminotransferase class I/II-fold pyridoxal phosphate-dependent enzyme [Tsukamurella sp. 8J]MDF0585787.1 aminotransferase class I/II-fold pyridoxal phosphate-dependent enzyme [Tsukamurella sp. 8F]